MIVVRTRPFSSCVVHFKGFSPIRGGEAKKGRKRGWGERERHCGDQKSFGCHGGILEGGMAQSHSKHFLNGPSLTMQKWKVVEMFSGESISLMQTQNR
jgi:hypothetical protein